MNIGKLLFTGIIILASFAGIGVLHIAQITGLVNVQVSITPADWQEETAKTPRYSK